MLSLSAWIQVAGAVQLAIGLANLPLARRLQHSTNLAGVWAMVRQVFYVHAAYEPTTAQNPGLAAPRSGPRPPILIDVGTS